MCQQFTGLWLKSSIKGKASKTTLSQPEHLSKSCDWLLANHLLRETCLLFTAQACPSASHPPLFLTTRGWGGKCAKLRCQELNRPPLHLCLESSWCEDKVWLMLEKEFFFSCLLQHPALLFGKREVPGKQYCRVNFEEGHHIMLCPDTQDYIWIMRGKDRAVQMVWQL